MPAVLYVDDEATIRRAVQLWLRKHGVTVFTATGVGEALDILATERVDGVFIDAWLEDGTGFDVYDWIRAERPTLARNVAFITGDTASPSSRARLEATGRPVLAKPFDLEAVRNIAASWARGGGSGAVARGELRD
ncbi:MAG TPA: response regulator [Gemmatimonadaceae bacterium]|nr:response regulator [Gemmatimonadaceae bacterium]